MNTNEPTKKPTLFEIEKC